jgi:hypothetical protein
MSAPPILAFLIPGGALAAQLQAWQISLLVLLVGVAYAVIVLYRALAIRRSPRSPAGWEATPYDGLALGGGRQGPGFFEAGPAGPASPLPDKFFDVFLSYKSEDAELVRQVADALIAGGLKVWFAEYLILLVDRDRFQDAIDDGLRRSRFGVLFTNDRYAQSDHCRYELTQLLLPEYCGAGRLLEVRVRDEPLLRAHHPGLSGCPWLQFRGDVGELLRFIQQHTALPGDWPAPPAQEATVPALFQDPAVGYTLDVTGWTLVSRGRAAFLGQTVGPKFQREFGDYKAVWNLVIGSPVVAPRRFREGQPIDDRECFDVTVAFAQKYLAAQPGAKCAGVHLFFLGGLSHFVVTYWRNGYWGRRYSIILTDAETNVSTEFAFAFALYGPFDAYCRRVPFMDRVVLSFERW